MAYSVEKRIRQVPQVGVAPYRQVHAHSTGNLRSTAQNEADYYHNKDPYLGTFSHIVGNGRVIQVSEVGRGFWDVGGGWNAESYAAVELIESHATRAEFDRDYKIYCELLHDLAKQGGIPLTVDDGNLAGIKTHNYCTYHQPSNNSDHVDPIPYLAKWGIDLTKFRNDVVNAKNGTVPTPSTPTGTKNGIAIDNVSKDQAVKMVQRLQTEFAWTLLRDQVKAVKQNDGRYTLAIKTGKGNRLNKSVNRLSQELRSYYPGYMQQNVAIVNGDKDSATIEARNMPASAFAGKNTFDVHMRNFLKDILLDGQTYAEANSYGTYDVRIKGEGFNDHDAPIVLKQIQEMGKAKDVKIDPSHIKGFKY